MKRYVKISALVIFYLLCSARSCNHDNDLVDQTQLMLERDSITREFAGIEISNSDLQAKENVAIQKLKDVVDFLNVCLDPSSDPSFKSKAVSLIVGSFKSENNTLSFYPFEDVKVKELLTSKRIDIFNVKASISIDSISIVKHLIKTGDSTFIGQISFFQSADIQANEKFTSFVSLKKVISFCLVKREKSFGDSKVKVWQVLLGGDSD